VKVNVSSEFWKDPPVCDVSGDFRKVRPPDL